MIPLLLAVLAQAPAPQRGPVAPVVVSKRPGADAFATKIAARVHEVLKREGVAPLLEPAAAAKELKAGGFSDPRNCQGGQTCVTKLAVVLGARAVVVGVDVGKIARQLAIHLEAVAADKAQPLASVDISVPADNWSDKSIADITQFVRAMKGKLAAEAPPPPVATAPPPTDFSRPAPKDPPKDAFAAAPPPKEAPRDAFAAASPPPKDAFAAASPPPKDAFAAASPPPKDAFVAPKQPPTDAPRVTSLEPEVRDEPPAVADLTETAGPSKAPAWGLMGGAVAAAGVGAAFGVLGLQDKARYDAALVDGGRGTTLTAAEANALAQGANTKLSVALTSALVSAGLAGASTYFFVRE